LAESPKANVRRDRTYPASIIIMYHDIWKSAHHQQFITFSELTPFRRDSWGLVPPRAHICKDPSYLYVVVQLISRMRPKKDRIHKHRARQPVPKQGDRI